MKSVHFVQTLGGLSLLGMLALSSPGVVTSVRAESLVGDVPPGPSCSAQTPADTRAQLEHAMQQAMARAKADPNVVVLNNRGYRYGKTDPMHQMQALIDAMVADQHRRVP